MTYFFGLIVPSFSFFLQIWPRYFNKYFGIDTWRHLMYADYVRKNGRLPKNIKDRYIVNGPYGYPPIIIWILSLFPKRFAEEYQFIFSPIFDFLHNYFIFLIAYITTKNLYISIISQTISALTPIVVMEASNLNTRVISYLIYSISFLSLIFFTISGSFIWLGIAFFFLVVLFFTHRFALQVYFFNLIAFAIAEKNLFYPLFFVITFSIVLLFGGDLYKSILREHIAILKYWKENIDFRFAHQFRNIPKPGQVSDFVYRIYLISFKNPFVYILGNNPWIGVYIMLNLLVPLSKFNLHFLKLPLVTKFNVWIISSLVSAILVLSIKRLRFLGEGNRYVEYSVLPISIILGIYIWNLSNFFGMLIWIFFAFICTILLLVIVFLQKKTILQDRARTVSAELREFIKFLNINYGKKVRMAVFPFSLGDAMMYFLKGRVLTSDSVFGLLQLFDIFPIITTTMDRIIRKYRLNFIFFDRRYVRLKEMKLHKYKKIMELKDYILLKV